MDLTDEEKKVLLGKGYVAQKDGLHFACRIAMPGGKMTARQGEKVADLSVKYGQGYYTFTQRLNVEIPWIQYQDLDNLAKELKEVGLAPGSTGRRVRPVLVCKGSLCKFGLLDTESIAQKLDERFYQGFYDVALPNKLRIVVSGCGNGCSKPQLGCIGLQGRQPDKVAVIIQGMFGKEKLVGRELPGLFSLSEAMEIIEKAIFIYREKGIAGERFAKMVERIGFESIANSLLGLD
ncbi:sulfite reductase subunit beta (hemoprotein) [Desulfosporosinus sp. PR]|uniref:sulfite reductase subunit beta (hemoprotein) n=1 Tax=Candidatus Desulfosporosinus nitrosoreducens TaxID=3401928 RepID=UPI0027F57B78|nr:sulfite reductase subunit beta (hemoprotein) [Desulfosporosinus sp. PR]MDQ7094847.1 sulfite reductase subunit beta (hemoprotein) [Desulfosporosinus sp. PR]